MGVREQLQPATGRASGEFGSWKGGKKKTQGKGRETRGGNKMCERMFNQNNSGAEGEDRRKKTYDLREKKVSAYTGEGRCLM